MGMLEMVKPMFIKKMGLLKWEAGQWIQYQGYDFDADKDMVTFRFKSSSYGISFDLETKAFSSLHGKPDFNYSSTYRFFRNIKHNELKRD
tara:strand:+ start:1823 stop:2092 length:270 start_codon:yes stop_codon:yes gene_type:complete